MGSGNGVSGRSPQRNGIQEVSGSYNASGVYGENTAGGYGVAGRTFGLSFSYRVAAKHKHRQPEVGLRTVWPPGDPRAPERLREGVHVWQQKEDRGS